MRSKRVPDRVHVVRSPEQDGYGQDGRSIEIVRMLAQISDKLKRSEAERYELLSELREYRKSLRDLEDKSENSEKIFLAIENKLKTSGSIDSESLQRQVRFEKTLKATEEKMVKAIAGQALIDKRLQNTEDKQTVIDQRLDESASEQTRIGRQLELTSQDKSRMLRKVERLEEIVTDTQDSLQAKAMVLLTDQSTAAQSGRLSAPAWGAGSPAMPLSDHENTSWWKRAVNVQTLGMTSMVIAALLGGWTINQIQQPEVPQIAVLENGGLARLNLSENRWEPIVQDNQYIAPSSSVATQGGDVNSDLAKINDLEAQKLVARLPSEGEAAIAQDVSVTTDPASENVLDYSDDQLLAALNDDPDKLAAQLNNIEPSAVDPQQVIEQTQSQDAVQQSILEKEIRITAPMRNFDKLAFKQNVKIKKAVEAERDTAPLASRIKPDTTLSDDVKSIEAQAFAGNAEAQHDLAAIYTAGHGDVSQNFEKSSFWFREAAEGGIANARYNLGVLYHQGLGQERDLSRALYWYREAAKLGHAEAQYNLGIAHIEGIGTDYDPRLASAFFEHAANNGIMEAAYNLGLIYENGLLGDTKPDEALLWYKIAADQGSGNAKTAMAQLAKNLQIDMKDVDNLVERMQKINKSVKGYRAGPQSLSSSTLPVNEQQATIAQIQEYLMLTGAYAGPADGINGAQTGKAIKAYQAANNLTIDGKISKELLNNMLGGATERLNR